MPSPERPSQERETLVFSSPEQAGEFTERVEQRVEHERTDGVDERREAVGAELEKEFEREGLGADVVRRPWEHTQEEHAEVQELVDIAFESDLRSALRKARTSAGFPRNLDLLHDVLTTELHQTLSEERVNRVSGARWAFQIGVVVLAALLLILIVIAFA